MSTRLLFIFLLVAIGSAPQAQTVVVSDEISLRESEYNHMLGKIDDRLFSINKKPSHLLISAFDENLKKQHSSEFVLEKKGTILVYSSIINSKIRVVYFYKNGGEFIFKLRTYNKALTLLSNDTLGVFPERLGGGSFEYSESEDESKLLVYRFKGLRYLEAQCYDLTSSQLIWSQDVNLINGANRLHLAEFLITNRGTAYVTLDRSPPNWRKSRLVLEFIRISAGSQNLVPFEIVVEEIKVQNILVAYDNLHDQIILSGLYSDGPNSRSNGFFLLNIDGLNHNHSDMSKYAFPPSLESKILAEESDRQAGISDLVPKDLVFLEDGSVIVMNEISRRYQRRQPSGVFNEAAISGLYSDYHIEDVLLSHIDRNGELSWTKVLNKKQVSQDDFGRFSSFFIFKNRNALRLFYNDDISSNGTVSEYILTPYGDAERNSLVSTEDQQLRLVFSEAMQLSGTSFIVPSELNGRLKWVLVDY